VNLGTRSRSKLTGERERDLEKFGESIGAPPAPWPPGSRDVSIIGAEEMEQRFVVGVSAVGGGMVVSVLRDREKRV